MGIKSIVKKSPFAPKIKKWKKACFQVKKNKRDASKLEMLFGSFKIRKFNSISGYQLEKLLLHIDYPTINGRFYYYIDQNVSFTTKGLIVGNIPVDYSVVLEQSLNDCKKENTTKTIDLLIKVIDKIVKKNNGKKYSLYLNDFITSSCKHFEEALQRILFINQMLWQTNHTLVGLGRLDLLLTPYYISDLKDGVITSESAELILKDFLVTLHKHYTYKSNTLLGDTGQIIILGGKNRRGEYFCSDLTEMFIDVIAELKLPDPKVLLRCANNMPRSLMEKAVKCMCTGIGCPLLANDEVIIQGLINNGYSEEDSYNYGTSACWEPLIPGKSTDQNNMLSFKLSEAVSDFVSEKLKENYSFINFDDFLTLFSKFVVKQLEAGIDGSNNICYEEDPIQSLFLHDTHETGTDLSSGTVKYNYYGILMPGFSNGINSLLNIKRLVFETSKYTLREFSEMRESNFDGFDSSTLKDTGYMYGEEHSDPIEITNAIISTIDTFCSSHTNKYNFHYKFGLSSPSYITSSASSLASFDGRKNNEPFGVHISSNKQISYTELLNFCSKIDYSGHNIDGNVADFIVSPNFVENHFDKFVDFMLLSISNGFFEMQMNVLSSLTLKDALNHPEKYKNLIVRVWGFSAYFNDLPLEYKLLLIKRTEINEGLHN